MFFGILLKYSTVECSTVRYNAVQYNAVGGTCSAVHCSAHAEHMRYSIVQCGTRAKQHNVVRTSHIQCSAVQYSTVQ